MFFILVIILLSLLILGHEAGHFFVAKILKMRVDEFGFGFPPRMFSIQKGETTYSFNWLPFGGFVRIAGEHDAPDNTDETKGIVAVSAEEKKRFFSQQSAMRRSMVILAGVAMNFLLGFLIIIPAYMVGTEQLLIVNQVQENSPAAQAGIRPTDTIKGFSSGTDFINYINQNRGTSIPLEIVRGRKTVLLSVTPRTDTKPNEGALGVQTVFIPQTPGVSLPQAVLMAGQSTYATTIATVQGLWQLLVQLFIKGSIPQDIAGPVGIVSFAEKTASVGFVFLLNLLSLISINLAVMNLLPFPALDGGRFVFIMIEKLKGSPVSRTAEAWVNGIGFIILIALMIVVTIKDISRI
ncbi:MAG: hypothetical protein RIQ54_391 [Candidatus Parcubacteria bacterium]|jgi:regulator of sigma E protease